MSDFLTGILVLITGVYAWLTWKIACANQQVVEASREQTRLLLRPYVHLDFQFTGPLIEIVLTNTGKTAARDVTVDLQTPLNVVAPPHFAGPPRCVAFPVTHFPPGKVIVEMVCSWEELEAQIKDHVIKGAISYTDGFDQAHHEEFVIDMRYRKNSLRVGRRDVGRELEKVGKALEDIHRAIEKRKA